MAITYELGPTVTMTIDYLHNECKIKGCGDIYCKSKLAYTSNLLDVYIYDSFDSIKDQCFSYTKVKSVTLKDNGSYKHIGNECFLSSLLERVEIPETLETIGHNNFSGKLTSFNIPSKIVNFPADNLIRCNHLSVITVSKGNTAYRVVDGVLYNYDMTVAVFCPNAMTGTIILPNTVKHIGEYCFYGCKSLKKVVIPPSVETIGDYAFCSSTFDKLVIPNSVKSIGIGCFRDASIKESLRLSSQIHIFPDECFTRSDIKNFTYPYCSVVEIGNNALYGVDKKFIPSSVSFESLKRLGKHALYYRNEISTIELFSCLEEINENAFEQTKEDIKLRYFSSCPIRLSAKAFRGLSDKATLIVPKGSKIIFQNTAPWSAISNICECDLDIDYDNNGNEVAISDEVHLKRIKSVIDSKIKADRNFLRETIEDIYQNYLYVDSDEEYEEAMELIKYNRSFPTPIVPELEHKMYQCWTNKYKLKLASKVLFDNQPNIVTTTQEESITTLPVTDTLALPEIAIAPNISEAQISNIQVIFNSDIQKELQNILSLAKRSVKIAVSWFTNYTLFKQIKEMATSGIKIQLITNNDLVNNGGYCLNLGELIDAGAELSLIEYPHLLHHKFCIIDEEIVVNGSYNWTRFSAKNYENITVIRNDVDVIEAFTEEFENLLQNAEHKYIAKMPESVQERPEYDRSAFRQYVTEELDAEARETHSERDKITALHKAASLNSQYLKIIDPEAKGKYAEAFKTIDESVKIENTIASMVNNQPASTTQTTASSSPSVSSTNNTTQVAASTAVQASKPTTIVTKETQEAVEKVKASDLFMVLDVSGSMRSTYSAGHVHSISKKALSASLAISESKKVSLWTFGDDAQFVGDIGIDSISKIDQVSCKNCGTKLSKFVETANSSIKDNALVVIFTDDDSNSIKEAITAMQQRTEVFWQIIVYESSYNNITESISNITNTSVITMTDYASKTDEQISHALLKDYIEWKKNKEKK